MGDLFYQDNNLEIAKVNYLKSIENKNITSDIRYKLGYIDYENKNYKGAKYNFSQAEQKEGANFLKDNVLLFAKANASYLSGNYNDSIAMYKLILRNIDILNEEKIKYSPRANKFDHIFAILQIKTLNNLGVSNLKLNGTQYSNSDSELKSKGLTFLEKSHQLLTDLNRDIKTMAKTNKYGIPESNLRKYLKSSRNGTSNNIQETL